MSGLLLLIEMNEVHDNRFFIIGSRITGDGIVPRKCDDRAFTCLRNVEQAVIAVSTTPQSNGQFLQQH